ncbi:MAG: group I truncated hemoglobin [Rubrivivax sp.]|jgi:hemoglobin
MTLFDKYGGVRTVKGVVSAFYRDVMASPSLRPYFEGVDLPRLIEHQVKFISHVMGQPASVYEGRTLEAAHQGLRISPQAFGEVAAILEKVLRNAGVEDADVATIMSTVAAARPSVVASV